MALFSFEFYLPAGNYSVRARIADAGGVYTPATVAGRATVARPAGTTEAASMAALDGLTARLDRLAHAPQLMLLAAAVADALDGSAASAAAAAAAKDGGRRVGRQLRESSAGYRDQVSESSKDGYPSHRVSESSKLQGSGIIKGLVHLCWHTLVCVYMCALACSRGLCLCARVRVRA